MFDPNFFPTPAPVIDKMIAPVLREYGSLRYMPSFQILEPSAGKGDILDRLVNVYSANKAQVFAIEKNPELQLILSGKGYRVIDADFLTYGDRYAFDLILMNPPFDDGADHLLKAWDILRNGRIVCLLNAETVRNPHTEKRKLLKTLIDAFGETEFIGQAFKQSERPTDVEVVIVRLCKETASGVPDFDGAGMDFDAKVNESAFSANPLAHPNIIQALVDQYNHAARLTAEIHALHGQFRFYTNGVIVNEDERKAATSLNADLTNLKQQFWKYVFDKTKLGRLTTSNFRQKFEDFTQQTAQLAFSEANIMNVLGMFFQNHDRIIQECIVNVFDTATAYHEKNRVHTEGWKTNKSWKLNKRIIMPNGVSYEPKWDSWSLPWRREDFFKDIDKALCFIAGKKFEDIRSVCSAIEDRLREIGRNGIAYDGEFESEFFRIRVFKKGTVHLDFKDLDLLAKFNIAASKGKGWLGDGS